MPITGTDWEMHIVRKSEQKRGARRRKVGTYKVFHGGVAVAGLSGAVAETRGPGDNSTPGNNRRIEKGRYPLSTQAGTKYVTIGFTASLNPATLKSFLGDLFPSQNGKKMPKAFVVIDGEP